MESDGRGKKAEGKDQEEMDCLYTKGMIKYGFHLEDTKDESKWRSRVKGNRMDIMRKFLYMFNAEFNAKCV